MKSNQHCLGFADWRPCFPSDMSEEQRLAILRERLKAVRERAAKDGEKILEVKD